jgi:hypothetical protein
MRVFRQIKLFELSYGACPVVSFALLPGYPHIFPIFFDLFSVKIK